MKTCPRCGHVNRQEATWCEKCQKGLTLGGRMAEPWGKTGIASRITTTWALWTGAGCLLLFLFPPLGIFLLIVSAFIQSMMKKAVPGVCPHCGEDTGTIRRPDAPREFPCVHCGKLIVLDASSGKPVFAKAPLPAAAVNGATTGTAAVETAWTPIGGAANFRTREFIQTGTNRFEFRSTTESQRFFLMHVVVWSAALIIVVYKIWIAGEDRSPGWAVVMFLAMASSGYMYYRSRIPWIFDKRNGTFSKSRLTTGNAFGAKDPSSFTRLDDVHALQLLSKNVRGRHSNFISYELNLVLRNGERVHVVAHSDLTKLRENAAALAKFLGKPLLERV